MESVIIRKTSLENGQDATKRTEISTKKEWDYIVEKVKKDVDKYPILTYIYRMKEKIITINTKGASTKQWSNLLLELNLVKKSSRPYGVDLQVSAPGLKSILHWGTATNDKFKRD